MGGEGFEPPKAYANGFTVRPGSPTPASAQSNAKIKASDKYIFIQTKMQIFWIISDYGLNYLRRILGNYYRCKSLLFRETLHLLKI